MISERWILTAFHCCGVDELADEASIKFGDMVYKRVIPWMLNQIGSLWGLLMVIVMVKHVSHVVMVALMKHVCQ